MAQGCVSGGPHLGAAVPPLLRALLAAGASWVLSVPATAAAAAPGHPRAAISCSSASHTYPRPTHTAAGCNTSEGTGFCTKAHPKSRAAISYSTALLAG